MTKFNNEASLKKREYTPRRDSNKNKEKKRKNFTQRLALKEFYSKRQGVLPTKSELIHISEELDLTTSKIYKYFWDMKQQESKQTTEVLDSCGMKPNEFEPLAIEMGIDVDQLAFAIVDMPSPTATRQIIKLGDKNATESSEHELAISSEQDSHSSAGVSEEMEICHPAGCSTAFGNASTTHVSD